MGGKICSRKKDKRSKTPLQKDLFQINFNSTSNQVSKQPVSAHTPATSSCMFQKIAFILFSSKRYAKHSQMISCLTT
jgi:hypothetical protein